jgi:poly(3-hydroxybutyrate) depolymerase
MFVAGVACGGESGFPEPVPDECVTDVSAGHHQFECDDMLHDVTVPAECLSGPCGLVVDVHGTTMDAQMEDNNTGMRSLGMRHGYLVYQPNAHMLPDTLIATWVPSVDDPRILAFIQRLMDVHHLDADRIHMTGFSAGGYVAWRFVCAHSDLLASAAPAGAGADEAEGVGLCLPELDAIEEITGCSFQGDEIPSPQIDILFMNGTLDNLHKFPCAAAQRDQVIAGYQMGDPQTVSEDEMHTWIRYTNANGTVFEFIQHEYTAAEPLLLGHCYPGSQDLGEPQVEGQLFPFGCEDQDTFVWGEAVMDFFLSHPKS